MKPGYKKYRNKKDQKVTKKIKKKGRGKQLKALKAAAADAVVEDQMDITAEEAAADKPATEETAPAKAMSRKEKARLRLQESKAVKAKVKILKKSKHLLKYNMSRGIQGATNLTKNELSSEILRLSLSRSAAAGTQQGAVAAKAGVASDIEMAV